MSRLEVEQAQLPTIAKKSTPARKSRRAPGDNALAAPHGQGKGVIAAQVNKTLVAGLHVCLLPQDLSHCCAHYCLLYGGAI